MIRDNICPLPFVDVFVWAYRRSCLRYSAVQQSLGEPDPFQMRYRREICDYVTSAVREDFDKREAASWIARKAKQEIRANDCARFIEIVETELGCLHEGNITRYSLLPEEFISWKENWH